MTAIITIVQADGAVHMLSDSVAHKDGKVVGLLNKMRPIAHDNVLLALRGPALAIEPVSEAFRLVDGGLDGVLDALPATLRELWPRLIPSIEAVELPTTVDIVIAGISARLNRPAAAFLCNHDGNDVEPWQAIDLVGVASLPGYPGLSEHIAELNQGGRLLDPEVDGLAIMRRQ